MMSKPNTLDLVSNLNLEAERKFAAQSNRAARIKIEKGHAWLVRFLPFPQGPSKQPFARIAQHWVGGRPFMCKRHTAPEFDGDPEAACPVCDIAEQMYNEAADKAEQDLFYGVQARIAYRAYCLVFCKENDRGDKQNMGDEEMLTAYEFMIPKSSFPLLAAKIDRSKGRQGGSVLGLLDLENGSDLWAIRDKKNSLTFDNTEDGPGPIFTLDDAFDTKIQRVWKQLKQPSIKFLDEQRLNAIADMIAEKAFEKAAKSLEFSRDESQGGGGRNGSSRGGSAPRGRFHEGEDEPAPRGSRHTHEDNGAQEEAPARPRTATTGFSRAQAALEEQPAQEEDQVPGAEVPPVEQEAPPARTAPRRAPVQTSAPADTGEPSAEQTQEEAPPVSTRRAAGATARPAAAPGRVAVPPSVAAGRRAAVPPPAAAKTASGRIEEETPAEDPPEEQTDPAPPAEAEATPAPARAAAPARGALQGQLRQSVANMAQRGR